MGSGYSMAMELAGAKILAESSFGDYQGSWFSKVDYNDKVFWVVGNYGSCSGCDSFQDLMEGLSHYYNGNNQHYIFFKDDFVEGCPQCQEAKLKVIEFGKTYLDDPCSIDVLIADVKENQDWDLSSVDVIKFLEENK